MKVRLKPNVENFHLTQGKIYEVISVSKYLGKNRKIDFTVLTDEFFQPARFDSDLFDIIDPSIDNDWAIDVYGDGMAFNMQHKKLTSDEFWEDFYGDDNEARAKAIAIFKEIYPDYKEL